MLTIRLQRRGRKKLAQYRVVVQDSRFSPTSGKVVEYLGSYDPHAKTAVIDKETAQKFLNNGAQPSDRVARLLKSEGVKLPKWVKIEDTQSRKTRNPEKLRKNQPKEEPAPEEPKAEEVAEAPAEDAPADAEVAAEEKPAEEAPKEEASTEAEEPKEEKVAEADAPAEEKADA